MGYFREKTADKEKSSKESLEREITKEKLRVSFANASNESVRWCKNMVEALSINNFGFTLPQVIAHATVLAQNDKEIVEQAGQAQESYSKTDAELKGLGVSENSYTPLTVSDLDKAYGEVKEAQTGRQQRYADELKRQKEMDALCKKFADKAIPFTRQLAAAKEDVANIRETLEKQLEMINARIASADTKEGAGLHEIKSLQGDLESAAIQTNPYTLLSWKDIQVQWQQYLSFLARKKQQIEDEINHHKLRGITPQQMAEIEKQFAQYDTNGNKVLDPSEFKACLYSLGLDSDMVNIKRIMTKYGGDEKNINYNGFKEFMIAQLGDTDTKEEIINGFKLINRGGENATAKYLNDVLSDADVGYIQEHAPSSSGGLDYTTLTNKLFAR